MLEFSLFGIPFTGADICGFRGRPSADLCRRWYQLGAYYPLSRSHNTVNEPDQDPGYWAEHGHPEVTTAAVEALRMRYQLLHYLYTCFYRSHLHGETLVRPLHHIFPSDPTSRSIDQQFFLGPSIMITPFLYENQTQLNAYVPNHSEWYKLTKDNNFLEKAHPTSGHIHLTDQESNRPILFRAGSIIPIVEALPKEGSLNTRILRTLPLSLWILPEASGEASGDLFHDDGESLDTIEHQRFSYFVFSLKNCQLTILPEHRYKTSAEQLNLKNLKIPLSTTKTINQDNLELKLDGFNSSMMKLPTSKLSHNELVIDFTVGPVDLLQLDGPVSVSFKAKNTGECFTH